MLVGQNVRQRFFGFLLFFNVLFGLAWIAFACVEVTEEFGDDKFTFFEIL